MDYQLTDTRLVWSDEFNNDNLDLNKWNVVVAGNGFGNGEWQYYTDRTQNLRIEDGHLVIEIIKEEFDHRHYTSARIHTVNKSAFTYGRIEARIKVPGTQGIWPAFWMIGSTNGKGWPNCGEIDIMEKIGREPFTIHGTVHGPGYAGAYGIGESYSIDEDFSNDFHVFAIEWIPGQIEWFVDGNLFFTLQDTDLPLGVEWPFDHDHAIVLNTAVGGSWPDYPDETTLFPQQMLVEWVRVFQSDQYPQKRIRRSDTVILPTMHLAEATLKKVVENEHWYVLGYAKILDQDNNPVPGVTMRVNFTGLITEGLNEMKQQSNHDGMIGPFISETSKETGKVSFCIKNIEKDGWKLDIFKCVGNTVTLDHSG